jgi:hypothetical protein
MTEVDVMSELLFCINRDCANCSRGKEENCKAALMRDARSIIKLQNDAVSSATEAIDRLKTEIERYKRMVKHSYEKKELVEAVNRIIGACMEDNDCPDCGGDFKMESMVDSIKDLLKLIGWENCLIKIGERKDYPDILWHE